MACCGVIPLWGGILVIQNINKCKYVLFRALEQNTMKYHENQPIINAEKKGARGNDRVGVVVFRKGDIVKDPIKKAPLCPKMYQGWGGCVGVG